MVSTPEAARESTERAVSPVIGVILMVAITVILAAVIGAFVLEIGNQQETAPTTSFESEQSVKYFNSATPSYKWTSPYLCDTDLNCDTNLTELRVSHSGGDSVQLSQLNIKVNGNKSVWGLHEKRPKKEDLVRPQPDHFRSATSDQPVYVTAGETWKVFAAKGFSDKQVRNQTYDAPFESFYDDGGYGCANASSGATLNEVFENPSVKITSSAADGSLEMVCTDRLQTDDAVAVVWRSSSGGKTQTLTRYTVQEDGAPGAQPK